MSPSPVTLRVAQFVYSNVEADQSKSGRRGYQVWKWSPRLHPYQREIARRLEDFKWPHPDAARRPPTRTTRLTFFPIKTDRTDFVIARTVPVQDLDALRRAGRFHAHAVVVADDEFRKVGYNPFAVFDGFEFEDTPRGMGGEVEDELPVTVSGEVPAAMPERVVGPDGGDLGPPLDLDTQLLGELLSWLALADPNAPPAAAPKPAAIPAHPHRVAGFLRALFRQLPPDLRPLGTFDTLSLGQSLRAIPFRFVGAYNAAALRNWSYRNVHTLNPGAAPDPPLDPPAHGALAELAARWAAAPGVDDERRSESYRFVRWVVKQDGAMPGEVSGETCALVRDIPGVRAWFEAAVEKRLADAGLGPGLRGLRPKAGGWAGEVSPAAVAGLGRPATAAEIVSWLYPAFKAAPNKGELAAELAKWAEPHAQDDRSPAGDVFKKLFFLSLWCKRGGCKDFHLSRDLFKWDLPIREWAREKYRPRLPLADGAWAREVAAALLGRKKAFKGTDTGAVADQLAWHLALSEPSELPPTVQLVGFALAAYQNDKDYFDNLTEFRLPEGESAWLLDQVLQRSSFEPEVRTTAGDLPVPGYRVVPIDPPFDEGSKRALAALARTPLLARPALIAVTKQNYDTHKAHKYQGYPALDKVRTITDRGCCRDDEPALADAVAGLTPDATRAFVKEFVRPTCRYPEAVGADGKDSFWFGLRPGQKDTDPTAALWRAFVGAMQQFQDNTEARYAILMHHLVDVLFSKS